MRVARRRAMGARTACRLRDADAYPDADARHCTSSRRDVNASPARKSAACLQGRRGQLGTAGVNIDVGGIESMDDAARCGTRRIAVRLMR